MKSDSKQIIGVITGDIVGSRALPEAIKVMPMLNQLWPLINRQFCNNEGVFETFRGDGFQLVTTYKAQLLRIAIVLRAALLRFPDHRIEMRMGLGVGPYSHRAATLADSIGPVFEFAGLELDKIKDSDRRMAFLCETKQINEELKVGLHFTDAIIANWSSNMAATAFEYLTYRKTQAQLAQDFNISQPAVHKRFKSANIEPIERLIQRFEQIFQAC